MSCLPSPSQKTIDTVVGINSPFPGKWVVYDCSTSIELLWSIRMGCPLQCLIGEVESRSIKNCCYPLVKIHKNPNRAIDYDTL